MGRVGGYMPARNSIVNNFLITCYFQQKFCNFSKIHQFLRKWKIKNMLTASMDKNNGTNDKFYRKVAILMYTEMLNFRPQS